MYRDGHAGFNALLYAPVLPVISAGYSLEVALWGAVLILAAATLPDFDQGFRGSTTAGRRTPSGSPCWSVWVPVPERYSSLAGDSARVASSGSGSGSS